MTKAPDWEGFGRAIMEMWQAHCDLDAADRFEWALKYNLLREVVGGFDPESHDDEWGNAEEGDDWYEVNYTLGIEQERKT